MGKPTIASVLDEVGCAIAAVELDAHAHGLTGQMLGARDCLRAVAAIRDRVLPGLPFGKPMPPSDASSTDTTKGERG